MTKHYCDANGNHMGGFDGDHGVDTSAWTEVPAPSDGRQIWNGTAWMVPKSVVHENARAKANEIIGRYVDPLDWSRVNDALASQMHGVVAHYGELVAHMKMAVAVVAAYPNARFHSEFDNAMNVPVGGKTHWQKATENAAEFDDLYGSIVIPIRTWMDKVAAEAKGVIDGSITKPNWDRFEQGAEGDDAWMPAWSNMLDRFTS